MLDDITAPIDVFSTSPVVEDNDSVSYTVTCRDVKIVERVYDYNLYNA